MGVVSGLYLCSGTFMFNYLPETLKTTPVPWSCRVVMGACNLKSTVNPYLDVSVCQGHNCV